MHATSTHLTRYLTLFLTAYLALAAFQPPPANAQAGSIDLAFCMNGSGSISAADFSLQKLGIQAALGNSQVFPRNGSIGLTLIQYSSGTTQVHIPYTVIHTEADAQALINTVNNINQLQGCTNPGDGISTAWAQLAANGDLANNQQILCLFTDGLPNCGANASSAISNANASGLDRFTVVAIEDPPFFFESDFKSYYGSLVFGGGAVTVASNTVEFANFVGTTCLFPNIELIGMEANQAVQDWMNSVDLVANKTTYIRAHVKSLDPNPIPAQVRLRAHRNNVELGGSPLTALSTSTGSPFTAQTMPDRDNWDHSINFKIPDSWTTGAVTFTIEAIGGGLSCSESAGPNANDCKTTVTFQNTDVPEIRHVRINWADAAGTAKPAPTTADITELQNRLRSIYPAHDFSFSTSTMRLPGMGTPDLKDILNRLRTRRILDLCFTSLFCDRIYYGVLVDAPVSGLAFRPGKVGCGNMPANQFAYGRNRHAHEVGHNLNRSHAPFCTATSTVAFPHSASIGGTTVATIGPMASGDDALMYGLDDHLIAQRDFNNGIVDPNDNFELMSYCGTWRWISDFTYEAIRNQINTDFLPPPPNTLTDYMVIRGTVDLTSDAANFSPFLELATSANVPTMPAGAYSLVLKDNTGNTLTTIPFQPDEMHADFPSTDPGEGFFIHLVEKSPNIAAVEVQKNGTPIGAISGSSNAPTVEVTFPNGGEFLSANTADLQWAASDPDGGALTFTVQYSKDGGNNWETLIVDHPSQNYTVELSELAETTQGRIRVIASDGYHTAKDQSDGNFTTPNNAPSLMIATPTDNSFFSGVQPIFFEALVDDKEEGTLDGSSVTWASSQNGNIGTGKSLFLTANQLSTGFHTITATATDGGGLSDSKSISIEIFLIAPQGCGSTDNTAPEVECLDITVQLNAGGEASIIVEDLVASTSDNCGTVMLSAANTFFDCSHIGVQTVTVTADDGNGNTNTCEAAITVEDAIPPAVTAALYPVIDEDEDKFEVACSAYDQCDGLLTPSSVIEIPMLVNPEIDFETSSRKKLTFDLEDNEIEVEAPDPESFWAQVSSAGGVPVADGQVIELEDEDEGQVEYKFHSDGRLRKVTRPCISLSCTATDFSNQSATAQATACLPGIACSISSTLVKTNVGTIRVMATCSGTCGILQYSLNGGAPQSSPVFSGLSPGTYTVTTSNAGLPACSSEKTITIDGSPVLYVLVATDGDLEFDENISHLGGIGILSDDKAEIEDNSIITAPGTFVMAQEIDVDNSSSVAVQIEAPATPTLPTFRYNTTNTGEDVDVADGEIVTLTGSTYDDIEVEDGATLIFSGPSSVFIDNLTTEEDATIIFNQCTNLMIDEEMELGEHNLFNPNSMDVAVFAEGDITVKRGSQVNGILYTQDKFYTEKAASSRPNEMRGLFIGKEVESNEFTEYTAVSYDPGCSAARPAAPAVVGQQIAAGKAVPTTFLLYPNPAASTLHLSVQGPSEKPALIRIFDMQGRLMAERNYQSLEQGTFAFELNQFTPGIYTFMIAVDGGKPVMKKFVVQR